MKVSLRFEAHQRRYTSFVRPVTGLKLLQFLFYVYVSGGHDIGEHPRSTPAEFKDICHVFSRPDLVPTRDLLSPSRRDINYTSYTTVSFKFGSSRIIHDKNNNFSFNIGSVIRAPFHLLLRQQIKIKRVGEARLHEISIKISISLEGIEKKE